MRNLLVFLLISGLMAGACTSRNRVGPEHSDGNGGVLAPDSTTRYDTSHPREHSDTSGQLHDTIATPDTERASNPHRHP
ncbi:MAG TPA: hypothetical protein VGQ51_06165 [Puia sp.]|nr:hypothetical protein [Puia sp.]